MRRVLRAWPTLALFLAVLHLAPSLATAQSRGAAPDPKSVRIDLDHILVGRVNRRGELVGLHHQPSAPRQMRHEGKMLDVVFEPISPGGPNDVRTAQATLCDPRTKRVVLEKFSTLYPDSWDRDAIERSIREAYADARNGRRIDSNGRWQGKTKAGVRIDGFLSYDGKFIASAFPVYVKPERGRPRR